MNETIKISVNGEQRSASVVPRTQLAEVLRDELDLTGTHLGCEQGVCGACTVIMNGRPVRSCITFVGDCDGAEIRTTEGGDDPLGIKLTEAFSRHHALQCGFCTPGMLATARDIVTRFPEPDEKLVRHELSGNICRCTGYQGIVAAILDVSAQARAENLVDYSNPVTVDRTQPAFRAFKPIAQSTPATPPTQAEMGKVAQDGSWTVVTRGFDLAHPVDKVWGLFSDISAVAPCLPGASLQHVKEDTFEGAVEVAFGPIKARFLGKGTYFNDAETQKGNLSGGGTDRNGQSRVSGEMHYAIAEKDLTTSHVDVELRFKIEGPLAQFNRPELVTGFVDFLLQRFVRNCDAVLSGKTENISHKVGAFSVFWAVVRLWFKRSGS